MFLFLTLSARHPKAREYEYMNSSAFHQLPGTEVAVLAEATRLGSLKAGPQEPLDPTWQLQGVPQPEKKYRKWCPFVNYLLESKLTKITGRKD